MTVRVQTEDFDLSKEVAQVARNNRNIGAVANFIGLVRDMNEGSPISEMILEHYPGMTEKTLETLVSEAKQRWNILDALVVHRIGRLKPGDQIVLVVVASSHRGEAFAACEFLVDFLKTQAPFWKKEATPSGNRWVETRESDDSATQRWRPA